MQSKGIYSYMSSEETTYTCCFVHSRKNPGQF